MIDRFVTDTATRLRPVAVWAHGSLAGGDFQPGRSDLDLIVVIRQPLARDQITRLTAYHRRLYRDEPAAAKLHCSYLPATAAEDASARHFTWAAGRSMRRPVSLVTRCELLRFGRVLAGATPADILSPVSDEDLAAYIRYSLRKHVLDVIAWPHNCFRDSHVDLCTLIVARAAVTLRDGCLITKGEALAELTRRAAPPRLVADIRRRRYGVADEAGGTGAEGEARATGLAWRLQRALMFRRYVRAEARELLRPSRTPSR